MNTKLSIITVVHQNLIGLQKIYSEIRPRLGPDCIWIIKDSASCQETKEWGQSHGNEYINFISKSDKGIYNALNDALTVCDSEFYLVVGSDDSLNTYSLELLIEMIKCNCFIGVDIVSFPVIKDGRVIHPRRFIPTFISMRSLITSHSVGTLIRKSVHEVIGYYDERYRILADSFLLRRAYQLKRMYKLYKYPVIGEFSTDGISHSDHPTRIKEAYQYNVSCGDSALLQRAVMFIRNLKYKYW